MRTVWSLEWRAVAAAALLAAACGGGGSGAGTGPTVPITSLPTPTPAPTTEPTAEPPLSASCARLPAGNPNPSSCRTEAPTFLADVEAAIDTLRAEQPGLFDGDQVLNVGAYYVGLIRVLDRRGLCADFDGEELGVTNTHDYSDVIDVLTARDQVRRFYVGTCYPALVPHTRAAAPPANAGCRLAPSREVACGRESEGRFFGDVSGAVDRLLKEKPELFDFGDTNPGTGWPRIRDFDAYHSAVVGALTSGGYCALFDGEEIQLKRTNELSEHYDVNYADRYIRTGSGIYRGSCYPAAF